MFNLTIIKNLLPEQAFKSLENMAEELASARLAAQIYRTETEARISVLNDLQHPTPASKYWQCVTEQVVMLDQLVCLSFEYRRNELKIKQLNAIIKNSKDDYEIELAIINLDECTYKKIGMEAVAADRYREIEMWSKLKSELNDGSFDIETVDSHQLLSYTARFCLRVAQMDKANYSAGELDNLLGQYQTALRRCESLGLMAELQSALPGINLQLIGAQ